MEKYVFSGCFTNEMHDRLKSRPNFKPLDMLISQVDRAGVKKMVEWKKEGFCGWLFIDSGAFSVHTGKAKTTVEEYAELLNSIDDVYDVCAQLDTIPGKFGQPKSAEDYVNSAENSWKNYLYMRTILKSPDKLMPVYHFGEDVKYLQRMLEWKDENGNHINYLGLSPANDAAVTARDIYLKNMFDIIKKSSNPNVKTHIYGFTSLPIMAKYPCYSADSITHRLLPGYGKVISPHFGVISVSKRDRTSKVKSNYSFLDTADEYNMKIFAKECENFGVTIDDVRESVSARVAFTVQAIQQLEATTYKYHEKNLVRSKKLF